MLNYELTFFTINKIDIELKTVFKLKNCPAESGGHPPTHALAEAGGWHHQSGLGDSIVTGFRRG